MLTGIETESEPIGIRGTVMKSVFRLSHGDENAVKRKLLSLSVMTAQKISAHNGPLLHLECVRVRHNFVGLCH
jgi:hypothetical protein